jgi:fructose-bisphosphate aldolase class II
MPIATREQYAAMLDAASAGGYALAAINVTSSETLNATMRGFAEAGADGIVQVTTGAAEFASGSAVGDMALGARALAEYAHVLGERYPVAIALHTDHAPPDKFDPFVRPLLAHARHRVAAGREPLFNSHMFDGSTLPLVENLRLAAGVLDEVAPLGIVLEVEVGVVGGEEDGVAGPGAGNEKLYTTAEDMLRAADVLGTGERGRYLLAATFGMCTASTHTGRSGCAQTCCSKARTRSPRPIPARASSTSSTAAAARATRRSARRSATAW